MPARRGEDQILWPGYFGAGYEAAKIRVLLVGAVHNEEMLFDGHAKRMHEVEHAAFLWAANPEPTDGESLEYLRIVQEIYPVGIEAWVGSDSFVDPFASPPRTVWGAFCRIVAALGLTLDAVAFTNLAKCKLRSPPPADKVACRQYRVDYIHAVTACLSDPIAALPIDALEPDAVFIQCGQSAVATAASERLSTRVRHLRIFDQPSAQTKCASKFPLPKLTPWRHWLEHDVAHL